MLVQFALAREATLFNAMKKRLQPELFSLIVYRGSACTFYRAVDIII